MRSNAQFGKKYTPEVAKSICEVLAQGWSITRAAKTHNIGYSTIHHWRDKYPEFDDACAVAIKQGTERIEDEAVRRAVEGVERPVFGNLGEGQGTGVVGHVTEYSDQLMSLILKGRFHERYGRDRVVVSGDPDGDPVRHSIEVSFVAPRGE